MIFFDTTAGRDALSGLLRLGSLRPGVQRFIDTAIPRGALAEEFTDPLLFVLSIRLNQLTGGAPGMTFSARCHISSRHAHLWPMRVLWAALAAIIDLYCACFRGEVSHCETAWFNHRRRERRVSRADPRRRRRSNL